MSDYVKASPHFFRIIKIAFAVTLISLLVLAFFMQAPLQGPADVSRVPNPSKSAWFLMWTQELVSYATGMVYLILALGLVFLLLPWLPLSPPAERARWFSRDQRAVNLLTVVSFLGIVVLTVIAMYFRGENWSFVFGF
ncbi:MAG TPA: cytochrome B6 [Desulfobacteraceae bacterium]|nr:cytochrome B6 [Desulfobacteraceae bacterium]